MSPSWLNLQAYAFDKPIAYKNLLIYPALMEHYFEFYALVQCFLLEKNLTIEGISKTYLEYLYILKKNGDEEFNLEKFDALLKMCLRLENIVIIYAYEENRPVFIIYKNDSDANAGKNGDKYTSDDFNELRLLICEQNGVELPDETMSPEVRKSMEEARQFIAKRSGTIPPTLEDMVTCIMASTALKPDDIAKLSIRKFGQLLYRVDTKLHYQIFVTASMSGFVEFKDKSILKHWMAGVEKDRWGDTMIDVENMKGKLAFDDKKKK